MCEGKPCFVRNTFVFPSELVLGSTASSRVRFFRFFFVPGVLPLFLRTYICWMSVRRSGTSASLCQVRHAVALIAPRGVGDARAAPGRGKRQIRGEKGSLRQGREREGGPFPFGNGRGKQAPRRGERREKGVRFTVEKVAGKRDPFVRGSREEGIPMPGPWGDGKETPSLRGWSGSREESRTSARTGIRTPFGPRAPRKGANFPSTFEPPGPAPWVVSSMKVEYQSTKQGLAILCLFETQHSIRRHPPRLEESQGKEHPSKAWI